MTQKLGVVLSLISHTNIGKTTLARTLLRRDVGEVRDASHVTIESTRYTMIETDSEELVLWDTPGFGHVGQLVKRLEREHGAWGWLMNEVVDRVFNRSLFSSLEAVRNIRDQSDVVLYLVNVQEEPHDAGYVDLEFQLLEALAKPVVLVLNQVREDQLADKSNTLRLKRAWHTAFSRFSCLREVVILDAFTRSWNQELVLVDVVAPLLPEQKRTALLRLRQKYEHLQEETLRRCAEEAGHVLWFARHQSLDPAPESPQKEVFIKMVADLQNHLDAYVEILMEQHGIEAEGRAGLQADMKQVAGFAAQRLDEKKSGLLAGALSSAGTGLIADILSGGLSFGGGALLGFLGGYFGGLSYAKLFNMRRQGPLSWKVDALVQLFKMLIGYYLLSVHHGRGKGKLPLDKPVTFLASRLDNVWLRLEPAIQSLFDRQDPTVTASSKSQFLQEAGALFRQSVNEVLGAIYGSDGQMQ